MITVQRWSGMEIRALREAKRMSIREFAAHLGVSYRMISKWEAGAGLIQPRPVNQAESTACNQARHPVDGKLMTLVDAGVFLSKLEGQPVWLPACYIDVYPTTNADYARFVAATGHRTPMHWVDGACTDNLLDHPVVFVTWRDAHAYAEWAGKTLRLMRKSP